MLIFDYNRAMAQVRELRQIANDMLKLKNGTLSDAINTTGSAWQGQTSRQFQTKCNILKKEIDKEVANIKNIADSLENTARAIEMAERKAASLITGR